MVIAILAVISIVAYNGISDRTNDSAVQSDIRNFAMKIREQHAIEGVYPLPAHPVTGIPGNGQPPAGLPNFNFTRGVYDMSVINLFYCVGNIDGAQHFAVAAISKSGKRWMHHSLSGQGEYTSTAWGNGAQICNNGLGFGQNGEDRMFTNAINAPPSGSSEGTWKPWVK